STANGRYAPAPTSTPSRPRYETLGSVSPTRDGARNQSQGSHKTGTPPSSTTALEKIASVGGASVALLVWIVIGAESQVQNATWLAPTASTPRGPRVSSRCSLLSW